MDGNTQPAAVPTRFGIASARARIGSPFRVWKDFGPQNTFEWTDADHPGMFEIEVCRARPREQQRLHRHSAYTLLSNVTDQIGPSLIETSHPLGAAV